MNRILAVIPAFNEEKYLPGVVRSVRRHRPELDILVVDDGSTDSTPEAARQEGALLAQHAYNAGYGVAIQTGLKYALRHGYSFAVTLDGDGQHEPACLERILEPCLAGKADLVIGSRYLEDLEGTGRVYRGPLLRRAGSALFGALGGKMTGSRLTDPTSGFLALNERALRVYTADHFPDTYPDANALVLAHRAGLRILERSVTMYESPRDKKSMHAGLSPLGYVFEMLLSLGLLSLDRKSGRKIP
ncbi:MAG: glycosyltransferase family 2 protein [Bdellovibrionota bacterium]